MNIYDAIRAERARQDARWGEQNHPDLRPDLLEEGVSAVIHAEALEVPTASAAKGRVRILTRRGRLNWGAILVEEVAEVVDAAAVGDLDDVGRGLEVVDLERELVQVAAVCVAWLEALQRRRAREGR